MPTKDPFQSFGGLSWVLPARIKLKDETSEPSWAPVPSLPRVLGRFVPWVSVHPPASRQVLTWIWAARLGYRTVTGGSLGPPSKLYTTKTHTKKPLTRNYCCLVPTAEAPFSLQQPTYFLKNVSFYLMCMGVCLHVCLCITCVPRSGTHRD